MYNEFEITEELESQADLVRQSDQSSSIPSWMRENLESDAPNGGLPDWVKENLDGTDSVDDQPLEEAGRRFESVKTWGNIIREFFQKDNPEATEEAKERYNVTDATEVWHVQEEPYSCANACQEFIIDEYLGIDVQESELNDYAREQNWLKEEGTSLEDIGNLMELYGIETHRYMNAGFDDIKNALDDGNRVIVAVHNAALDESWCDFIPVVSANHAVEVVGIDDTDPKNVKVIVNDPGVEDGCGKVVTLDTFNQARDGSGGFMVVAERP